MPNPFIMPKLGLTMEEGTIAEWLVPDGATIAPGDLVLRIETDKTETDVEASAGGVLHVLGEVGQTFPCGELVGWLLEPGEEPPAAVATGAVTPAASTAPDAAVVPNGAVATQALAGGRLFASPNARRLAAERSINLRRVRGTGPNGRIVAADLDAPLQAEAPSPLVPAAVPAAIAQQGSLTLATFAARSLADLLGVDIATVPADARTGKVTRDAVASHVRGLLASGSVAPSATKALPQLLPALQQPTSTVRFKGMRGTIASRMHESLQQMAQLSLFMDADLDAVVADRNGRKAKGAAPSYTDYVMAAAARALQEHPHVNAQVTDDGIALLPDVHVGIAVALDDGLIVPVVKNTAARDLADLSTETARLAGAARAGSLDFADLEGGTFSVSTLGMFGVDGFTPIINPPNAAILGVGRLRDDLVLGDDGNVRSIKRLTLSLTWDHRVFDGAPAAAFTARIAELLQDPSALDAT